MALLAATVLITFGTMIVYPFEMDTALGLAGGRLVATHYGVYSTLSGVGIAAGNLAVGAAWDPRDRLAVADLPWLVLTAIGVASTLAVAALARTGRLAVADHCGR